MLTEDPSSGVISFGGGRYALIRTLRTTETGGVFLGVDKELGVRRAIKLLDASVTSPQSVERFLAEARVLEQIEHPHLVRGCAHGREQGFCWYVMELLPGGTLQEHLVRKGALPLELALPLTFQVLMGVDALHAAGLVHRDIKLTNILVDDVWNPRLTDLGVAHHPQGTVDFHTIPGQALGTPGYGSPEQWTDPGTAGAPADLFATGVLLFRLLTRRKADRLHLAHLRPSLLSQQPKRVRELLLQATRPVPAMRYQDAQTMARAVSEARDEVFGHSDADLWMAHFRRPGAACWTEAFGPLRQWLQAP
jgi:serine/threonine protein kinase